MNNNRPEWMSDQRWQVHLRHLAQDAESEPARQKWLEYLKSRGYSKEALARARAMDGHYLGHELTPDGHPRWANARYDIAFWQSERTKNPSQNYLEYLAAPT